MPFSTTGSVISTDLDNMVRGIYRDNSDNTLSGSTSETTLKSVSVAANTIGATGGLHIVVCGSTSGINGTKTFKLKFGTTTLSTISYNAATATPWIFDVWIFNTSTTNQRVLVRRNADNSSSVLHDYATSAEDTTANKTLAITGQLGSALDSITATMMDVFVVQIT